MPTRQDRRANPERRNVSTRRRHVEVRSLNIELCHSVLRVAIVVDDQRDESPKLTTRTVRWRREAPDLLCEQGETELAAALRQIVSDDRLAGCRVSFAISSTLCVNRASSGATAKVEQEITSFEERSQLYLSLGPGSKMSAVGRKAIDARHEHALVTVANRETIRLLVEAAESAGLVVDTVESSLVALSRLHGEIERGEQPVILAQLDEERFEIGVSRAGQLLLEYRPPHEATLSDLGAVVDDHYERLQRFCGRRYGLGSVEIHKIWLVGEPVETEQTDAKTKTEIDAAVLPMQRVDELWRREGPELPTAEMGAVLGLALRGRADGAGVSPNLMDEIHAMAKPPVKPFLMRAATPLAATLLLAFGLYAFNLEQRMELASLREEVDLLRPLETRGQRLSKRLRDASIEIEHLSDLYQRGPQDKIEPLVERIAHCLPQDLWLKQLRTTEGRTAELSGISYTEPSVYDFVHYLETAPGVDEVALKGTGVDQTPQGPATSFEIEVTLAPAGPAPEEASP